MTSPSIASLKEAAPARSADSGPALSEADFQELALPFSPAAIPQRTAVASGIVFIAYLAAAQGMHYLFPTAISPALIWPPAGIAFAGMALEGYGIWPAIILASLANSYLNGSGPLALAILVAIANALQAFAGAWLLKRFAFDARMERLNDALTVIFAAVAATLIVPVVRTAALLATRAILPGGSAASALGTWWTGEMLSVLVVAPFLIRWIAYPRFGRDASALLESAAAFALLVAIDILLFWTQYSQARGVPLVYLLLVPLIWIALRLSSRAMTLALLLNSVLAIAGTAVGLGGRASVALPLGDRLFQSEIFIIIVSMIFLVLGAIAEERRRNAEQLARNVLRLEEAVASVKKDDEAKSRFIATLAHELRNPLAPLLSSLELLNADPQKSDETRAAAQDMTTYVHTMQHLLDDLLDISRISRGKLTLQKEHLELHAVVAQSARVVEDLMRTRNHTLVVNMPDEAILLEADPVRLEQVIVNILNNAAKYTEPGGTITLSAGAAQGVVRISVKDTGIGIPQELQHRIFEPFLQLEENRAKLSGLGIGLSLTKNLVDMHEGTITVNSAGAGLGSEFVIELPYANLAAEPEPVAPAADEKRQFRILIADDNRAAADTLGKLLGHAGHAVEVVYGGVEALEAAERVNPDIILLDIGMPEMDGHETARRLRSSETPAVVIALTGYGQDSDRRKAKESGFNHHLTKPVGLAELEEVFAEIPAIV